MRHKTLLGSIAFIFLLSCFAFFPAGSLEVAFAKPPDWAPAHGYRKKKEGKHKHKHEHRYEDRHRTHESHDSTYSWTYNRIDINRDGRISLKEWNESKELFIILDRNRDGFISIREYERIDEQRGFVSTLLSKVKEKLGGWLGRLF